MAEVRSGNRRAVAAIPAATKRWTKSLHCVVFPHRSTPSSKTNAPRGDPPGRIHDPGVFVGRVIETDVGLVWLFLCV